MQHYFKQLTTFLNKTLQTNEQYTCTFSAERSDFVRFNHGKIRQAGHVNQGYLDLDLIQGQKHLPLHLGLSQDFQTDSKRLQKELNTLRQLFAHIPEDPHLIYATHNQSSSIRHEHVLPPVEHILNDILNVNSDIDFVGILASGKQFKGFANSFGQENYFETEHFNLDFSLYHEKDKAVKSAYAGFKWDKNRLKQTIEQAKQELSILKQTSKTITPGAYRAYLAPAALAEIMQMICWGGFSEKSHQTKTSALLPMRQQQQHLHTDIHLIENTRAGVAPNFQTEGFIKPDHVSLIEQGKLNHCLISPRTAKEYQLKSNSANSEETPEALELSAGGLEQQHILKTLDTGLYINNLWYLNYSDRQAGRMTGMTRFATFWVEKGKLMSPVSVMRFDDTLYRMLGSQLSDLTKHRDFILDPSTYESRSCRSMTLPGALLKELTLTL